MTVVYFGTIQTNIFIDFYLSPLHCTSRPIIVGLWLCLCVCLSVHRNRKIAYSFLSLDRIGRVFFAWWYTVRLSTKAYIGLQFLIYPSSPKIHPRNWDLSNYNAIHQVALAKLGFIDCKSIMQGAPPRRAKWRSLAPTGLYISASDSAGLSLTLCALQIYLLICICSQV